MSGFEDDDGFFGSAWDSSSTPAVTLTPLSNNNFNATTNTTTPSGTMVTPSSSSTLRTPNSASTSSSSGGSRTKDDLLIDDPYSSLSELLVSNTSLEQADNNASSLNNPPAFSQAPSFSSNIHYTSPSVTSPSPLLIPSADLHSASLPLNTTSLSPPILSLQSQLPVQAQTSLPLPQAHPPFQPMTTFQPQLQPFQYPPLQPQPLQSPQLQQPLQPLQPQPLQSQPQQPLQPQPLQPQPLQSPQPHLLQPQPQQSLQPQPLHPSQSFQPLQPQPQPQPFQAQPFQPQLFQSQPLQPQPLQPQSLQPQPFQPQPFQPQSPLPSQPQSFHPLQPQPTQWHPLQSQTQESTNPFATPQFDAPSIDSALFIRNLDTGEIIPLDACDSLIPAAKPMPRSSPSFHAAPIPTPSSMTSPSFDAALSATPPSSLTNYSGFYIAEDKVDLLLKKWLNSLWFAPAKVGERSGLSDVQRIFLPFWLFNVSTESPFSIKSCKLVEEIVNGKKVTQEHWRDVSGVHRNDYNNILISASSDKKDAAIAKEFKQKYWDLSKVVFCDGPAPSSIKPVAPTTAAQGISLFAKKVTDAFSKPVGPPPAASELMPNEDWISLWQTYEKGTLRKKERASARNQVMIQEKADKTKDLHLRITFEKFDKRLVYLPVLKCSYVYNSQSYKFYVNGQNGKVAGERPVGFGKLGELGEAVKNSIGVSE